MKAVVHEREPDHLQQPQHRHRRAEREQQPSQDGGPEDVPDAAAELVDHGRLTTPRDVWNVDRREQRRGGKEGGRVEQRHGAAAERGEQHGAEHRAGGPEPHAQRLENCVGRPEVAVAEHGLEERRARREEDLLRHPIHRGDRVDDPDAPLAMDGEQGQERGGGDQVVDDQHPPAREAVDDAAEKRREQGGRDHREEDGAAGAHRARELLGPDPEHEDEGEVAEQGERLARQEQAKRAVAQQRPRRAFRQLPEGHLLRHFLSMRA